jgi:uncharacterized membrane protein
MGKFLKQQGSFFLMGFVFWLPIIVVIFILVFLFRNIETVGRDILLLFVPEQYLFAGIGIVFGIVLFYLSGILLKLTRIQRALARIPIIGRLLGGGEVITLERLIHLTPCLFLLSPSCISYGWILSEENVKMDREHAGFTLINVYYPNVPSLITGQVFPVRKETVIRLGNPSKEIIDLLLYAFRSPKDLIYLPWENELLDDFETRAKAFGVNVVK